jgi:hypothetical protein
MWSASPAVQPRVAHLHFCSVRRDIRIGRGEGPRLALPIDHEPEVAFVNELVVLDPAFVGNSAGRKRARDYSRLSAPSKAPTDLRSR